jgi:ribokinase
MSEHFVTDWAGENHGGPTLVCGGMCLDHVLSVERLVPNLAKVPIVGNRLRVPGGGAANVALTLQRCGLRSRILLLAQHGDDPEGRQLRAWMMHRHIELPLPPLSDVPSGTSFIVSERNGHGTIYSDLGACLTGLPLSVVEHLMPNASGCCLVAHTLNEQVEPILRIARRHEVPVYLGLGHTQIYEMDRDDLGDALKPGVTLAICNRLEAAHLACSTDLDVQLDALRFGGRVGTCVITDGAAGIHAWCDGTTYHVPACADAQRPILDDTGAGDAAQGTLVAFLLRGLPLESALRAAARNGFEACLTYGATTSLLDDRALLTYLDAPEWQLVAQGGGWVPANCPARAVGA